MIFYVFRSRLFLQLIVEITVVVALLTFVWQRKKEEEKRVWRYYTTLQCIIIIRSVSNKPYFNLLRTDTQHFPAFFSCVSVRTNRFIFALHVHTNFHIHFYRFVVLVTWTVLISKCGKRCELSRVSAIYLMALIDFISQNEYMNGSNFDGDIFSERERERVREKYIKIDFLRALCCDTKLLWNPFEKFDSMRKKKIICMCLFILGGMTLFRSKASKLHFKAKNQMDWKMSKWTPSSILVLHSISVQLYDVPVSDNRFCDMS